MTQFKLIPEQEAIIAAGQAGDSLSVHAAAGAAKTTTIKLMVNAGLKQRKVLALAFNKRISEDLAAALPKHVIVRTLNSLGHLAWSTQRGIRLEVDGRKVGQIVTALYGQVIKADDNDDLWAIIRDGVDFCRVASAVPQGSKQRPIWTANDFNETCQDYITRTQMPKDTDPDFIFTAIQQVLIESIDQAFSGKIDFADQIYMSTCFRSVYPQFDCVIVDEAQDLSAANHRQLFLCKPKQLIAVGDPRQAIYAFRGADSNSMVNLEKQATVQGLNMVRRDLPVSFRCPKNVVARQQRHYPDMTAFHSNADGTVEHKDQWSIADLRDNCAVICRNNAPLVALAFTLLSGGKGFTFFGQDMGKNLKTFLKKVVGVKATVPAAINKMPKDELLDKLEAYYVNEEKAIRDKGRPDLLAGLVDRVNCARIVIKNSKTFREAMNYCDEVFNADEPGITLTSGHRSKGFEWSSVYHLDSFRIPSKFAQAEAEAGNPAPLQQEMNLRYVIETRTRDYLGFIVMNKNTDGAPIELHEEEV